jgi:hypothetical protein
LTFYGILIDEMSLWDKITAVPSKYGDFGAGDRKGTFVAVAYYPVSPFKLRKMRVQFCFRSLNPASTLVRDDDAMTLVSIPTQFDAALKR